MEAQAVPTDVRLGMVLHERYRILRKLGGGGMGTVYEAEHLLLKKRVAIKALHPQFAHEHEMVTRFQREAQAATSIGHPNIVEVNDLGRFPDGTPYMVLEFLEGRDWLADMKEEGPQALSKTIHIVSQLCDALGVAHAIGIVHRDLKPENVFLSERGGDRCFVKVVDFGISKMFDRSEESSLTETGTALGTPYYMAPEQCQGQRDIDGRADIYSLGVIMHKALTGQYPFSDASYPMLVVKICMDAAPRLAEYRTDLPPGLQEIVDRMLAKDRDQRFATCSQLKAALEPYRRYDGAPVMVANPPTVANRGPSVLSRTRDAPRPARTWLLLGGAVLTLALAVVFVGVVLTLAFNRPERSRPEVRVAAAPLEEPAATPPEDVAPPPIDEPPPQAPATVHVRISAMPANAQMTLDGDPIPNPFEADVARDPDHVEGEERRHHVLRVEAAGYRTHEQQLVFRFDNLSYPIELQRGRADNIVRVGADDRLSPIVERPRQGIPAPRPQPSSQRSAIFGTGGAQQQPRPGTLPPQQGTVRSQPGTVDRRSVFGTH